MGVGAYHCYYFTGILLPIIVHYVLITNHTERLRLPTTTPAFWRIEPDDDEYS